MSTLLDTLPFPQFASSLPIADRASLVGLNDLAVQSWVVAKADEYHRFASALLSIYSTVLPIHRLPFEILSKIFEGSWTQKKSLRLAHVCRHWRSVLLKTPVFWTDAVDGMEFCQESHHLRYLDAVLQRSSPRDIKPSFEGFSPHIHDCIAPNISRIISLEASIMPYRHIPSLWDALISGMPSLGTLTVSFYEDGYHMASAWMDAPSLPAMSPTTLPRLVQVIIPACLFSRLSVPSLQRITLKESPPCAHPNDHDLRSYTRLCEALAICARNVQTLELLGLSKCFCPGGWDNDSIRDVASLPALQHLRIEDRAPHCRLILSCLTFPTTTHLSCKSVGRAEQEGLLAVIPTDSHLMASVVGAIDYVEILAGYYSTSIHCEAEDRDVLNVEYDDGPLNGDTRNDLVQLFGPSVRVTELTVGGYDAPDSQNFNLRAFPHIMRLTVWGSMAEDVVAKLACKEDDGGPVCPHLETLFAHFHLQFPERKSKCVAEWLRCKDFSVLEGHLQRGCAIMSEVLTSRAQMGARVTRLELGWTERWIGGYESTSVEPTAHPEWVSWRPIVTPLEELVDGPVVFTGCRFFRDI